MTRSPAPRLELGLVLALTFSTGIVDAVGFLGLDRVFTGNMTGNVVVLGMGLAGAEDLPVLGPVLALAGFMLGAALGGALLRGAAPSWSPRVGWLVLGVGVVVLGLGCLLLVAGDLSEAGTVAVTTALGGAMGLQAATARVVAVKDVTTVVVTSTITGLAADNPFRRVGRADGLKRAAAVTALLVGALVGALLVQWRAGSGLVLAGAVCLAVVVVGRARRPVAPAGAASA